MSERVGPYEVTELLAAGGMAEIFVGKKVGPGGFEKLLVIKKITRKLQGDREIERMFVDEARIQSRLDHPHIVQIYDFGEDRGSFYMAMEFIQGCTLRWVIDNAAAVGRPVPVEHALRLVCDVLSGLHYAHERNDDVTGAPLKLIHRDISPVNILVARSGTAKLCDFGVAKSEMQSVHTRVGIVKGKFRYMSPEQLNAEAIDRRADVFAVGAVLWELIVGRRLFDQTAEEDVVTAIRSGEYPAPSDLRPGVPRAIDRILRRALHPVRDRRYKTAREFQLACEDMLKMMPRASNTIIVGEYVSAELDGTAGIEGVPNRKRQPTPENDSVFAAGFEMLDPPVPRGPTVITALPSARVDETDDRPLPPSFVARLFGTAFLAPATVFAAVGKVLESAFAAAGAAPKKRKPNIQVTRTTTHTE